MRGVGTDEAWFIEDPGELGAELGRAMATAQWRKPLSIDEVARMAPTSAVKAREGRA